MDLLHNTAGVVSSPNFPSNYPNNLEKTEIIEVEQGMIIALHFLSFNIHSSSDCQDYLAIMDNDGTPLMEKRCGSTLPKNITSTSNNVTLKFITSRVHTDSGWSLRWTAVTPGKQK